MFAYDFTRYFDVRVMGIVTGSNSPKCHFERGTRRNLIKVLGNKEYKISLRFEMTER